MCVGVCCTLEHMLVFLVDCEVEILGRVGITFCSLHSDCVSNVQCRGYNRQQRGYTVWQQYIGQC